ncbi:MAG: photosynthetic reaction center subunit H [Rhodocyclaceae bacterium]
MAHGAITQYIDVAQITLYVFWIFLGGLIYWLRKEDKREGYPLESDRSGSITVQGWPPMPEPKTFVLQYGGVSVVPHQKAERAIAAEPIAPFPGAPIAPTGNPLVDGVGPASYADRENEPDLTFTGLPKIVPLRIATEFAVEARDPDPRGFDVVGCDGAVAGAISDIWVDRAEPQVRYLEVNVAGGSRTVLLPINFARVNGKARQVQVASITAAQFADVPVLANRDQITLREEDRVVGYYGGGHLYADPSRAEPFL